MVVAPVEPWWRRRPRLVDAAVAATATGASLVGAPPSPGRIGLPAADLVLPAVALLGTAGLVLLLVRRTRPVLAWSVSAAISVLSGGVLEDPGRGLPLAAAALYAVARYAGRRAALVTTGATAAAAVLGIVLGQDVVGVVDQPRAYAAFAFCGLAAALGDAARTNRLVLEEAVGRAVAAESSRDAEARRQVVEERLRISRELHDVVGHHLAVVNVQAGVAEHLWDSEPATARAAVDQVRAAAVTALRQTGSLVSLLREPDESPRTAPGFADIPQLVESVRSTGAEVRWVHRGEVVDDAWPNGGHAYRLLQEALTNAVRHGIGPILVTTAVQDARFVAEVRNRVPEPAPPSTRTAADGTAASAGHGLVVMRERAALSGGVIQTRCHDQVFVVRVELPAEHATGPA